MQIFAMIAPSFIESCFRSYYLFCLPEEFIAGVLLVHPLDILPIPFRNIDYYFIGLDSFLMCCFSHVVDTIQD